MELFWVLVEWLEVAVISSRSAEETVNCLRTISAAHGLPNQCQRQRAGIHKFYFHGISEEDSIRGVKISSYQPASNGVTVRAVQTVKNKLKKALVGDFQTNIPRALQQCRTTPHEITGLTPTETL